jgi:threonine dehydratase
MRAVAAPSREDLDAAAAVVAARLAPTPVVAAPALGDDVYLKLETLQPTGSFKVRGALAALTRAGAGASVARGRMNITMTTAK